MHFGLPSLGLAIGLIGASVTTTNERVMAETTAQAPIPYSIATSRYFVKNTVPLGKRTFFVIRDFAKFESIFGYGATMGPRQPVVTAADFASKMYFVAVSKGGLCNFNVTSVAATGENYRVSYETQCDPQTSALFDVPVIVAVPKARVASVAFFENGHPAGVAK